MSNSGQMQQIATIIRSVLIVLPFLSMCWVVDPAVITIILIPVQTVPWMRMTGFLNSSVP